MSKATFKNKCNLCGGGDSPFVIVGDYGTQHVVCGPCAAIYDGLIVEHHPAVVIDMLRRLVTRARAGERRDSY